MGYQKSKETRIVTNARKRMAGMDKIDEQQGSEVEYGSTTNPCNKTLVKAKILSYDDVQTKLNAKLSEADEIRNTLIAVEKEIESLYKRTLTGAISKFGEDSSEVEMLGGTRKSERKRPVRKPK
jgi:hypothetical protein